MKLHPPTMPYHVTRPSRVPRTASAYTLMEIIVVVAVIIVLVAIAIPVWTAFKARAHKQVAGDTMRKLGGALQNYASQNNGLLPAEDAGGQDTWETIAKPEAKDAWYNALPRLIGRKGAGDFSSTPADFYTEDNILFLPGANYPDQKKFREPLFAIAFNTKLQRKSADGKKERTQMSQITNPAKTVVLLEQGVLNENATLEVQSKKDYDGAPKGSAKSFVGRYGGEGYLTFADGHVELIAAKELLTETGQFPFPPADIIWARTAEENPNKVDSGGGSGGGNGGGGGGKGGGKGKGGKGDGDSAAEP